MGSLYQAGWRQGTILEAVLPNDSVVLDIASKTYKRLQREHSIWIVASQDCDLSDSDVSNEFPTIELRPVFNDSPPPDWGIRSRRLRITDSEYIQSGSPRPMVSAALLTGLVSLGAPRREIDSQRRTHLTTWLGRRYDRPAVPESLVNLAKKIGEVAMQQRSSPVVNNIRDVLVTYDDGFSPPRYSLYAVLDRDADENAARVWLGEVATQVPINLGVADEIEAASAAGISLQLIEESYSADLSELTWRRGKPGVDGAT